LLLVWFVLGKDTEAKNKPKQQCPETVCNARFHY